MSDPQAEARRLVAARELVAEASAHLTEEVASRLPFDALVAYKTLLKRYFSAAPWSPDDDVKLNKVVRPHVTEGWWECRLADDLVLAHGIRDDAYVMLMRGPGSSGGGLFDRIFEGPVVPEPTPHPRKVKFNIGGTPAPGLWWQRGDDIGDPSAARLLDEPDVTDVMVAGDFVTVGLERSASWEERLDEVLALVTDLFWIDEATSAESPVRTRDELVTEGRGLTTVSEELHLLDPDRRQHRDRLQDALESPDARVRRIAVAVLAGSSDEDLVIKALRRGVEDSARLVRRAAVDAAADSTHPDVTGVLAGTLRDGDAWIRWKSVRALAERGLGDEVAALTADPDFQVRFEAERAVRGDN